MPAAPPDPFAEPPPRRFRALTIVAAALGGVVLVLALTIGVGYLRGANDLPGRHVATGRTGAEIYAKNCAGCHGRNGEGGSLSIKGPAFAPGGPLAGLTFEQRVEKIGRGRPLAGMPGWKFRISADDIRKVAAYTQILSGQQPDPSVEDVP
ncbi:MAG: cytochrome c oxidase cbb3-type subunit [Frankiaceae bacterium]|nr:cytochrome c oxidase cbb3-type subunit [Frankiaceae bacterium]